MRKFIVSTLAATALVTGITATHAAAQSNDDQDEARREMQAGNVLSLREIERRVLPTMRGAEYLGPSYDSTARAYRLKFMRGGRVLFVDVDARNGRILNRTR